MANEVECFCGHLLLTSLTNRKIDDSGSCLDQILNTFIRTLGEYGLEGSWYLSFVSDDGMLGGDEMVAQLSWLTR